MVRKHQTSRWAIAVLMAVTFTLLAGCAPRMVSGIFVRSLESPPGLEMFRLVESPRGHLSGSMNDTSLRDDGSVQNSAAYNVTGTVTGENVTLSLNGGFATVARWLGGPTDFVGTLSGDSLTLSAGNQVEQFQEVSQSAYNSMLADLRQRGARIAASRSAFDAVARVQRDAEKLNDDLNRYIAWARQRIDRAAGLRSWYEVRLQNYNRCLSTITPLAAAHVPSWKWQSCVLAVDNDSYARDFATRRAAMDEVVDWLGFYNSRRLHSTLDYVSPMTFEKSWFAAQHGRAA